MHPRGRAGVRNRRQPRLVIAAVTGRQGGDRDHQAMRRAGISGLHRRDLLLRLHE
jgi:hypothetical protein